MASLNKVIIIGHLGRDPECRYTPSGVAVVNFSVATSERWKDKATGQTQERTEWHNVSAFGTLADNCARYLSKGRSVYVEGSLRTDEYTAKNGTQQRSTKIIASSVIFLGGGERGAGGNPPTNSAQSFSSPPPHVPPSDDSDIPF